MVNLSHRVIYFDLAPVYNELCRMMELAGGEAVEYYLTIGEYNHLIRQVVWLELLARSGEITTCSAQLALCRYLRDFNFIGYHPQLVSELERELRSPRLFDSVEEAIAVPINPHSMIEPAKGTIWAFITGA